VSWLFNIKRIDISNFGNGIVPRFDVHELNIERINNSVHKIPQENHKKIVASKDIFEAIERRYNKFKYAYYKKGVSALDLAKINRCHKKSLYMLGRLRGLYRKLVESHDPRAINFGKKLAHAEEIVNKYGGYVDRLNNKKCAKSIKNVKPNRNKVRN